MPRRKETRVVDPTQRSEPAEDRQHLTYYRLLGLPPFESSEAAIRAAAGECLRRLRARGADAHAPAHDQRQMIAAVLQAKYTLLSPGLKAVYDADLRAGRISDAVAETVAHMPGPDEPAGVPPKEAPRGPRANVLSGRRRMVTGALLAASVLLVGGAAWLVAGQMRGRREARAFDHLLVEATAAIEAGRFDEARLHLQEARTRRPSDRRSGDLQARLERAEAMARLRERLAARGWTAAREAADAACGRGCERSEVASLLRAAADSLMAEAQRAAAEKRATAAAALVEGARALLPDDPDVQADSRAVDFLLAVEAVHAAIARRDWTQARAQATSAHAICPEDGRPAEAVERAFAGLLAAATAAADAGDRPRVNALLDEAAQLKPGDPRLRASREHVTHRELVAQVRAHLAAGRYAEAVGAAERARGIRPDDPEPDSLIGERFAQLIRRIENRPDTVDRATVSAGLAEAAVLRPGSPALDRLRQLAADRFAERAREGINRRDFKAGALRLEDALALAPDHAGAKALREQTVQRLESEVTRHLGDRRYAGATEALEALLLLKPGDAGMATRLADALRRHAAVSATAQKRRERDFNRLMARARQFNTHSAARSAVVVLDRALKLKPDDAEALAMKRRCERLARLPERLLVPLGPKAKMRLVLIDAGTFTMGSPVSERGRGDNEGPAHRVTITKPFYLGVYEVTQAEWKAVMRSEPWAFRAGVKESPRHPACWVSWFEAMAWVDAVNRQVGKDARFGPFRLPTEAEWEYACRAGSTGQFCYGNDRDLDLLLDYAWCRRDRRDTSMPGGWHVKAVGQKRPNRWGLHDMHGNVAEWCLDGLRQYAKDPVKDPVGSVEDNDKRVLDRTWVASRRAVRGGSWGSGAGGVRCAFRDSGFVNNRWPYKGFRVLREVVWPEK